MLLFPKGIIISGLMEVNDLEPGPSEVQCVLKSPKVSLDLSEQDPCTTTGSYHHLH